MDDEKREATEWTVEQAMAMFNASEPVRTRKRPHDANGLATSVVRDSDQSEIAGGSSLVVGSISELRLIRPFRPLASGILRKEVNLI